MLSSLFICANGNSLEKSSCSRLKLTVYEPDGESDEESSPVPASPALFGRWNRDYSSWYLSFSKLDIRMLS